MPNKPSRRKRRSDRAQGPPSPGARPCSYRRPTAALLVVVAAIVPYLNAMSNGFAFDDVPIVADNPRLRGAGAIATSFTADWWGGRTGKSLLYRPLTMSTFALDAAATVPIGGPATGRMDDRRAAWPHAHNVAWHAVTALALFALLELMYGSLSLSLIAGLLFAVHPIHTEAVDQIVGRAELLAAALSLSALAAALRFLDGARPRWGWAAGAAGAFLLALASKESAIVLPAVVLLAAWCRPTAPTFERRRLVVLLALLALAAGVYLGARWAVLGTLLGTAAPPAGTVDVDNPLAGAPASARLFTAPTIAARALHLLLFPRTLSADYSYDQIPVLTRPGAASVTGLAALAALLILALAARRSAPALAFGLLLVPITFAITANLLFTTGTIFAERLLFLPSAGISIAAAAALERLRSVRARTTAVALLVLLGGARTWARNPDWKSNFTLFRSAAAASPRSCKALDAYAQELVQLGRVDEALPFATRALAIHPGYDRAHATMGRLLLDAARDAAPAHGAELVRAARDHVEAQLDAARGANDDGTLMAAAALAMGRLLLAEGRGAEGLDRFREATRLCPTLPAAWSALGGALVEQAATERAPDRARSLAEEGIGDLRRALDLAPASAEAHQNLATALWRLARTAPERRDRAELLAEAESHVRSAIATRATGDAAPLLLARDHELLADVRLAADDAAGALAAYREAARLTPDRARCQLGIGATLAAMVETEPDPARRARLVDDAVAAFEHALALEPEDADAHLNLGILLMRHAPDPAKVAAHFRAHLRLRPDAPQRELLRAAIRDMEAKLPGAGVGP